MDCNTRTLNTISNQRELSDFLEGYVESACHRHGIKMKIYHINFFEGNQNDIQGMVDDINNLEDLWDNNSKLETGYVSGESLPIKNMDVSPSHYYGYKFIIPIIQIITNEINEKFEEIFLDMELKKRGNLDEERRMKETLDMEEFLDTYWVLEKYGLTFLTFFTQLIGQIVYNKKRIKSSFFLQDLVKRLKIDTGKKEVYDFILKILYSHKQNLKEAFLLTIKEQIAEDMNATNDTIYALYAPPRIIRDLESI